MLDEAVSAATVRAALAGTGSVREVRMFGGIGFMLNDNLVAASSRRGLLLRVGRDHKSEVMARSGARPMVMNGRTMEDYFYLDPPALNKQTVTDGVRLAVAYVRTLPPKAARKTIQKKGKRK
jgi:TfoX/Sxy family transcriptional regulator of competence genes